MNPRGGLPGFDVYAELGVSAQATPAQIKAAYRRKAKEHHPDIAVDKQAAEARMKRVNQARDVLLDAASHAEYDRVWATRRGSSGTGSSTGTGTRASRTRSSADAASRAERERRAQEAAERLRHEREAAERAAREAAARAERDRRAREAAERAERQRREREAAAQAARERRAMAAAERAARKQRAKGLGAALLRDDVAAIAQIHADGLIDWSRQRASVRFQVDRALERARVIEVVRLAVGSDDVSKVRAARRMAAATGAETPVDLRVQSRDAYRTHPRPSVAAARPTGHRDPRQEPAASAAADTPPPGRPDRPDEFAALVNALRENAQTTAWPDAARAWMGIRARWPDRVTADVRALGEDAVARWGSSLRLEGDE